jgi:ubiquinone/menaquinone biosynthesis C-methylase UbiE
MMQLMNNKADNYIPALSHDWLTPLYDSLIGWTMPEYAFKLRLIGQARIKSNQLVLDLGCGTGTLTRLIKRNYPDAMVIGIDGDERILGIAKRKANESQSRVTFQQAMAFQLPYVDASFHRALSSLVFHHLTRENKLRALKEMHRVLRVGGELHIADFGKPHNVLLRLASLPWRVFDSNKTTAENVNGLMPELIRVAGFVEVHESARYMTLFGTLSLFMGRTL